MAMSESALVSNSGTSGQQSDPEDILRGEVRTDPHNVLGLCKLDPAQLVLPGATTQRGRTERVLQTLQSTLAALVPESEECGARDQRASAHLTRFAVLTLKKLPSVVARCTASPMQSTEKVLDEVEMLSRRAMEYSNGVLALRRKLAARIRELREEVERIEREFPVGAVAPVAAPGAERPEDGGAHWSYRRRLHTQVDVGWGSSLFAQQQRQIERLKQRAAALEPVYAACIACLRDVDSLAELPPWWVSAVMELRAESDVKVAALQEAMEQLRNACAADHTALMTAVNRAELATKREHEAYQQWYTDCGGWLRVNCTAQEAKEMELRELPGKYANEQERLEHRLQQLRNDKEAEIERALQHSQHFLAENEAGQKEVQQRLETLRQAQEEERQRLQAELDALQLRRTDMQGAFEGDAESRSARFERMRALLGEIRAQAWQRCDALEHTQRCAAMASDLGGFVRGTFAGTQRAGERDADDAGAELREWLRSVHELICSAGKALLLGYARAMHLREMQSEDLGQAAKSSADRMDFCLETSDPDVTVHHSWLETVKMRIKAGEEDSEDLAKALQSAQQRLQPSESWLTAQGIDVRLAGDVLRQTAAEWEAGAEKQRRGSVNRVAYPETHSPRRRVQPAEICVSPSSMSQLSSTHGSLQDTALASGGYGSLEFSASGFSSPARPRSLSNADARRLIGSAFPPHSPYTPAKMARPQPQRRRVLAMAGVSLDDVVCAAGGH